MDMIFNSITANEICYQFVQANDTALLYYSHIPTALAALFMSFFVFMKSKKSLISKLLLTIAVLFCVWSGLDLAIWKSFDTRLTMFFWSMLSLFSMLLVAFSLYFTYVFFDGSDVSFGKKFAIFGPIIPAIILAPTMFNLSSFDAVLCEAVENEWFVMYVNFFGFFVILWITILAFMRYRKAEKHQKQQIVFFTIGMEFFLFSFFITSYLASLLGNFNLVVYGLFGMPVFTVFLAYIIVKYRVFNIKILGTQALVLALIFLISTQFFYAKTQTSFILTAITFLLVVIAGVLLIQSFKRSEERKEELQVMADRLSVSNDKLRELDNTKTEFISIASHQLRTPLTSIKGYCSLLLEGSYGKLNTMTEEVLHRIVYSNDRLVDLVENLLNVSRMEAGRMEYMFEDTDIETILRDLYEGFVFTAQSKKLKFVLNLPKEPLPLLHMDKQKMQEVFSNLIDNAIKYTQAGDVVITAERRMGNHSVRVIIKDSGIGIPAAEIPLLFAKFSRGTDINRLHANGTGLGLYVAKNIIEAHKGSVWIESDGEGKGTSFIVELG